jgi:phage terminase large subunit
MSSNTIPITVNPIYDKYADPCTDRYLMFFGGAGSGKSDHAATWITVIKWFLMGKNERVLVVRKVAKTIKNSTLKYCCEVIKNLGLWSQVKVNETDKTIVHKAMGNEIIMVGMDDPEKLKSIYKITKVWIEEASELEESDFLQIDLRLRGHVDSYYQILVSFNPVSDKHWLVKYVEPQYLPEIPSHVSDLEYLDEERKVWRFATVAGDGTKIYTTTINTTYKDNKYLDAAYITRLQTLASFDENYYQVYERGRWGVLVSGDRYCPNFKESLHVPIDGVKYIPNQPIHYSLDFNVKPHMTGLAMQLLYKSGEEWNGHKSHYELRIFKQYALKYPQNEARYLGEYLTSDYHNYIKFGVFLYGDASGNNKLGYKKPIYGRGKRLRQLDSQCTKTYPYA